MKLNTDRIVSLSAMAVGVGSLFIIMYQTHLMRQAQYASAPPYLMITIDAYESGIHVTLSNARHPARPLLRSDRFKPERL